MLVSLTQMHSIEFMNKSKCWDALGMMIEEHNWYHS